MKNITAIFIYLTLPILSYSAHIVQNNDSLTFVHKQWTQEKISKGVTWKAGQFESLFDSQQCINIIEIDIPKKTKKLGIVALPKKLVHTSKLAQEVRALAAINGGFFDMKNGGAVDYIKVNKEVIAYTKAKSQRANGYFAFDNKKVVITSDSALATSFPNTLLAGPLLIENRTKISLSNNPFNSNRHPRTAVAIRKDKLYFITMDGRHTKANGASLDELAKICYWLGCTAAMNLDGGGSTAMYIQGKPDNGVVNYPSDNKQFDHKGERKVSNIIYITK